MTERDHPLDSSPDSHPRSSKYCPFFPVQTPEEPFLQADALDLSLRLIRLQNELVVGKRIDVELSEAKFRPRTSATMCRDSTEAEYKLTRSVPVMCQKLLAGIKCFVCHGYGSPRLFCRNGHTICEDCDKSPKVATLNVCGLCDAPRLRGGVRLPAVLDDMYADAQDQVCPLCTDDTPRSVKELLRHVHHCSAVRTEEIRTNKYELMATRERWEMEACAILGRPEFVDEIRERMTVAFAHELYESDKKIDRLEKQLLAVERLNSELEKEAADTKELNAELVAEIKNRQKRDRDESASVMNADSKRVPEKSKRLRRELREEL
ncbi:hypothetical protein CYMTET_42588 [Cymbomonas tetramitiformis]|uniref:Uncharacterized protein n=1 Tax=Cymbomonas tetramitiformis TaxID=36881 RepID=A0AAE0F1H9_9CHLO|nr:hypothetical protein CYMTET_42588 [Cymbomonas tetramitiformis]